MTTAEAHTLTGAYALDAVTDIERAAFTRHLADCPTCAQEVAELRETAARLGAAMTTDPGGDLRSRVLAEIAVTRQAPPSIKAGKDPRRSWRKRVAVAAAAVAAAAAVFAGGITIGTARSTPVPVAGPVVAPDMVTVSAGGIGGGATTVDFSRQRGEAIITAQGLPRLDHGHVYQVWLISSRGAQSGGFLRPDAGTIAVPLAADVDRVGVTVEPAAGSPQPTTAPVVRVPLGTR